MWFVLIGVALILMKFAGLGPIAQWTWDEDWWAFLMPFALAVIWWSWADQSGYNKKQEMKKIDAKRELRRQKNILVLDADKNKKKKR